MLPCLRTLGRVRQRMDTRISNLRKIIAVLTFLVLFVLRQKEHEIKNTRILLSECYVCFCQKKVVTCRFVVYLDSLKMNDSSIYFNKHKKIPVTTVVFKITKICRWNYISRFLKNQKILKHRNHICTEIKIQKLTTAIIYCGIRVKEN